MDETCLASINKLDREKTIHSHSRSFYLVIAWKTGTVHVGAQCNSAIFQFL